MANPLRLRVGKILAHAPCPVRKSKHIDGVVHVFFPARPGAVRLSGVGFVASQGKLEEAGPLYKRSLNIRERVLGSDHPAVATSLNNLAVFFKAQVRSIRPCEELSFAVLRG